MVMRVFLRKGEMLCPSCNGKGYLGISLTRSKSIGRAKPKPCDKCKGNGKIDWVENITGKKGHFNHRRIEEVRKKNMNGYK